MSMSWISYCLLCNAGWEPEGPVQSNQSEGKVGRVRLNRTSLFSQCLVSRQITGQITGHTGFRRTRTIDVLLDRLKGRAPESCPSQLGRGSRLPKERDGRRSGKRRTKISNAGGQLAVLVGPGKVLAAVQVSKIGTIVTTYNSIESGVQALAQAKPA